MPNLSFLTETPKLKRRYIVWGIGILVFALIVVFWCTWSYQQEKRTRRWIFDPKERAASTVVYFETTDNPYIQATCNDPASLACLTQMVRVNREGKFAVRGFEGMRTHVVRMKLANGQSILCGASVGANEICLWKDDNGWIGTNQQLDMPLPPDAPAKLREMCQFLSDNSSKGTRHF